MNSFWSLILPSEDFEDNIYQCYGCASCCNYCGRFKPACCRGKQTKETEGDDDILTVSKD